MGVPLAQFYILVHPRRCLDPKTACFILCAVKVVQQRVVGLHLGS
uniref:Uncharacterized protein n=1 Tax=Peronospora matthiolae TaxID=2874970 RepID=A0AAV1TQN6_9STRA